MDLSKICRICLQAHDQTYDIFTYRYVRRNCSLSDMLSHCTKLNKTSIVFCGNKYDGEPVIIICTADLTKFCHNQKIFSDNHWLANQQYSHKRCDGCGVSSPCQDDGLPRLICKECIRQLKKAYTFNIKCEESARTLHSYIKNKPFLKSEISGRAFSEIKNEGSEEVKCETYEHGNDNQFFASVLKESETLKDKVKLESQINDDDCWDADDDNILLNIKHMKDSQDSEEEERLKEEKPKKRGRKKKVILEGETPQRPDSKLPHQCDICGKFVSTKSNLKAHKLCHSDLRPYSCPDCPATFKGHSALFQHRRLHTGETPYHCEYCPKQFSRRTGLVNHIRMHTGEKLYNCDICFKNFVQSAQLSIHKKRHQGDKPFLCQDCGKGFPIKADLKVHQRIHNGEKPYSCHLCTKTFATSGNLSIHVRIHNREIRYHCKECQRGFVTCSAYNVHLKRHKGQRDYHCECGKTFYTSSALKQHKVVHTGEKKYQCKICDRKFTQTSHLSRHFKRDHSKPNAPVPSSDHYKVVLQDEGYKQVFEAQKPLDMPNLKCEGT